MTDPSVPCTASMSSVLTRSMPVAVTPVADVDLTTRAGGARQSVRAAGVVAEVGVAPAQATAQFTALLMATNHRDPKAQPTPVRLVWQGQRAVPGVAVGVVLDCVGLLCSRENQPTIFNPRYEIVAKKVQR
ncbi:MULTISPECIES: hypothetical protein [Kocuria]|uniref:Uncharacterized protein n=1 Tax=Kocuria subflava TaxID=1736139 RepID=A0A846TT06_9MICC|nr:MULTISPECIES: hypothetical protein [Kocuria]NKE08934.1 hypothetical protein [Kocuria subflava]